MSIRVSYEAERGCGRYIETAARSLAASIVTAALTVVAVMAAGVLGYVVGTVGWWR